MGKKETSRLGWKAVLEGFPFLQHILQNVQQAVWVRDLETGDVIYVSPAFETVWGIPCQRLYADPFTIIQSVHPEDRVKVLSIQPDDHRKVIHQTYRILRPDGSQRWVATDTFYTADEASAASYQVCVAQDITDQSRVDQELRKALDRSREQFTLSRRMSLARKPEAVLKTLLSAAELHNVHSAFVVFFDSSPGGPSRDHEVVASWSSALERTASNTSLHEVSLFEDLAPLDLFHPSRPVIITGISTDPRLAAALRDALLQNQIQMLASFPLMALGNWLGSLLLFFTEEKDFEPVALRHIKVLVDQATITLYNLHLLKIEAESRHEAERANEIKTRFLAMISHELRTPLTSIKGFTTTLLAEDVAWDPEEQRDFIQTIQQETHRLEELIDHLLDLSRLEAGMLPITREANALQDIFADVLPQFAVMTQQHALSVRLPENLPPVFVDAKRIAQVLVNLVHNAVTYSPVGTEILLTAGVRGGFVQVSVIDQGPGIPRSARKRVFQAFQRGKEEDNGAAKGAGLGLAICKGLVEAHGGRIWIGQQNAPGTTISLTLPLVPTTASIMQPGGA